MRWSLMPEASGAAVAFAAIFGNAANSAFSAQYMSFNESINNALKSVAASDAGSTTRFSFLADALPAAFVLSDFIIIILDDYSLSSRSQNRCLVIADIN